MTDRTALAADVVTVQNTGAIKNGTDAVNYLNSQCGAGYLTAVAAFPSGFNFDKNTGTLTYTSNLYWRACGNGNTRAMAITGYPSNGGLATCPLAGWYKWDSGETYDCIKYTVGDAGHFGGYAGLGCNWGTNYACTNNPTFGNQVEVQALQPPTSPSSRSYGGLQGVVPNWSSVKNSSGSYPFNRWGAYCAYFKYNDDGSNPSWLWGNDGGGGCVDMSITVTWTSYNYTLTPVISGVPTSADAGTSVNPTGAITKVGTSDSAPTQWKTGKFTLAPGVAPPAWPVGGMSSGSDPSVQFSGWSPIANGSGVVVNSSPYGLPGAFSPDTLSAALPIGTSVCYTLSVQPRAYNSGVQDGNWQHTFACVTISKSPKIQISGGDLMVGRTVPAPSPSATISVSSRSTIGGKDYGSWVEYAAFAPSPSAGGGGTANILTGGCLASDYTRSNAALTGCDASQRKLTFANNTACGVSTFGCYGTMSARTNLVATYSSNPNPGAYTTMAATPTIDFGTLPANARYYYKLTSPVTVSGQLKPGMSVIIVSNSLITVAGDITDNGGSYNSLDAVPQVLLLTSGNIQINDTVSNINAWLYAGDTISTCNAVQVAPSKYTDGTGVNALGAGTPCDAKPLTINGPISAGHLQLRRTYGATGASGGSPADTAEAFNLRADASLWAKNQSIATNVITTVYTQELPPRY